MLLTRGYEAPYDSFRSMHLTPITLAGREERMKREQQDVSKWVAELAAAIEQRNWSDTNQLCDLIAEFTDRIRMDADAIVRSAYRQPPSSS